MRGFRFGIVITLVTLGLTGSPASARELTAADQAFLNKKIVARWNITGKGQIEAAYTRGIDILPDHPSYADGYFDVLISQDELDQLRADGYDLKVTDPDWYTNYAAKSSQTMGGFLTWDEAVGNPFNNKLDSFHTAYPGITSAKFSIGLSFEGNPMWAIKVSDNPDIDEDEPEVLFTGIHHSREPISMEIVLHTIRTLMFGYGTDQRITDLVNNREIYFVPFVNPDGYIYNELIAPTGGGMWRKNRRPNEGGSFGVDPNRNYGHMWGFDNQGSSNNPSNDTYRGTAAFSEPENENIRVFVNSRQFKIAINFHAYSRLYLWPPGWDEIYGAKHDLFAAIGDSAASFNGYTPEPGWGLYVVNGDSDDWMHLATTEHPEILAITPEVGTSFWPTAGSIPGLVNENMGPNLLFIDLADTPERILPPVLATWVNPDTSDFPDYTLQWSDPGGLNGAVSFKLRELIGQQEIIDNVEAGSGNWGLNGFTNSTAQAYSGTHSFWGGSSNNRHATMTTAEYHHVEPGDVVSVRIRYDMEVNYDYAYVEVSTNQGASFSPIAGNLTTNSNPNGANRGNGITGNSAGVFVVGTFSLSPFVGQDILIRLTYETDGGVLGAGVYFDDITPVISHSSSVVLEAATPSSSYNVTGKQPGNYFYALTSTDTHGQTGSETPPHRVTVVHNTPEGSDVSVTLPSGSSVTFDEVTTEGTTTVTESTSGPPPPNGISVVEGTYYDFSTTAVYTPPLTVCLPYDPSAASGPEDELQLFHYDGSVWANVTSSVDTAENEICGLVSSLSPFMISEVVSCACNCHADPTCDGVPTILDVIGVIDVAFRGAASTVDPACPHSGRTDVNCSGASDVIDVVSMVGVAFRGDNASTVFCDPCSP